VALAAGCSSADAERYDGAYGHHHWARVGFDHDDVNDNGQYEVSLVGRAGTCSGVLIGPDQVLTAAHCAARLTGGCPQPDNSFRPGDIRVSFDDQMRLDPRLAPARRIGPRANAVRVVAGGDGIFVNPDDPDICDGVVANDSVVIQLDSDIGTDRGWARMRETVPVMGAFAPTVHHPGSAPKKVELGRMIGFAGSILQVEMLAPLSEERNAVGALDFPETDFPVVSGSSGAPLFDSDGYVIATDRFASGCMADHICGDYVTIASRTASFHMGGGLPDGALAFVQNPRTETAHAMFGRIDASGSLDTVATHGTSGLGQRAQALAIAPRADGGFITGGFASVTPMAVSSPVLIAYDAAGLEDLSFGVRGIRQLLIPGSTTASVEGLAVQQVAGKDRILAVGGAVFETDPTRSGIFITRRLESGALDMAFAAASLDLEGAFLRPALTWKTRDPLTRRLVTHHLEDAVATSVALDSQGRIVVAGSGWKEGNALKDRQVSRPFVLRLLADGSPDPSCNGGEPFVWEHLWPVDDGREMVADVQVRDMAIDADDNLILAGVGHIGGLRRRPWVARILGSSCRPDTRFGTTIAPGGTTTAGTGIVQIDPETVLREPGHLWLESVAVHGDRIFAAGSLAQFDELRGIYGGQMVVMAFRADTGALDSSYGGTGLQAIPSHGRWDEVAQDLTMLPDGSARVVGRSFEFIPGEVVAGPVDVHRIVLATVEPGGLATAHTTLDLATSTDEWANAMYLAPSGEVFFAGVSFEQAPLPILIDR